MSSENASVSWFAALVGDRASTEPETYTADDKLNAEVRKLRLEVRHLRRQGIVSGVTTVIALVGVGLNFQWSGLKSQEAKLIELKTELRIEQLRKDSVALTAQITSMRQEFGRLQTELAVADSAVASAKREAANVRASLGAGAAAGATLAGLKRLDDAIGQLGNVNRQVGQLAAKTDSSLKTIAKGTAVARSLSQFRIGVYYDSTNRSATQRAEALVRSLREGGQLPDVRTYPKPPEFLVRVGRPTGVEVRYDSEEKWAAEELKKAINGFDVNYAASLVQVGTPTYQFLSVFVTEK